MGAEAYPGRALRLGTPSWRMDFPYALWGHPASTHACYWWWGYCWHFGPLISVWFGKRKAPNNIPVRSYKEKPWVSLLLAVWRLVIWLDQCAWADERHQALVQYQRG